MEWIRQNFAELAGKENLNDVYFTTAYTTVDASDELTSFIEAYKAEYDEEPDMFLRSCLRCN